MAGVRPRGQGFVWWGDGSGGVLVCRGGGGGQLRGLGGEGWRRRVWALRRRVERLRRGAFRETTPAEGLGGERRRSGGQMRGLGRTGDGRSTQRREGAAAVLARALDLSPPRSRPSPRPPWAPSRPGLQLRSHVGFWDVGAVVGGGCLAWTMEERVE